MALSPPCSRRALLGLAVALVAVAPPLAPRTQAKQKAVRRALDAHDVARLTYVVAAAMAPDGKEIAYLRLVRPHPAEGPDGAGFTELHLVDTAGTSRPFVTGAVRVQAPAWTPDGRAIAFLAKRDGDKGAALYVIARDGGEARPAVRHATSIQAFSIAPDGRQVAFLATAELPEEEQAARDKGFDQRIVEEDDLPTRVWVAALAPGQPKAAEPRALTLPGSALTVAWSPAGDRLAVTLAPTPTVDDSFMKRRIHLVDPAGAGKVLGTVATVGKLGAPAWSPDGQQLALITAADVHDPSEGRLAVVGRAGGTPRTLLGVDFPGHVRSVAWRDAGTVVAMADEGMATTVSAVDAATGARQVLVPAGGPAMWALSLSADGTRAAYVASTATRPWEVFGGALAGPLRALTDGNGWLDQRLLARQEVVRYKARDGLELEGVLIYPVSERAERRYPLVLVVHGGPEGNYKDGWMTNYGMPGQVAAGRGYAVFHPNYRGSTGRGVAFSKTSQGDPGGKEFDDLVDGVDHLVAAGLVDTARVGVTGGSYGGYATAWLATRYSERFAAGVMMVGISDKISKTGTTDIPEEELLVHARKRPWQDWQHFLERSPIYHADKGRTPLLVVHGARDPRVNPGQSLEMHRFLKLHGQAPVRLVLYPGEGHGNAKAAARLDYSLRQLRWLEHYLTHGRDAAKPPRRLRYEPPGSPTEKKGKATGAGHGKGKAR